MKELTSQPHEVRWVKLVVTIDTVGIAIGIPIGVSIGIIADIAADIAVDITIDVSVDMAIRAVSKCIGIEFHAIADVRHARVVVPMFVLDAICIYQNVVEVADNLLLFIQGLRVYPPALVANSAIEVLDRI